MDNLNNAERAFLLVPDSYTLQNMEDENEGQDPRDFPVLEFMCSECHEWTASDEPCCGVGPSSYNEDSINGDR